MKYVLRITFTQVVKRQFIKTASYLWLLWKRTGRMLLTSLVFFCKALFCDSGQSIYLVLCHLICKTTAFERPRRASRVRIYANTGKGHPIRVLSP